MKSNQKWLKGIKIYKEFYWLLAFGALFAAFTIYSYAEEPAPKKATAAEWAEKMQSLYQSLSKLLTYMSSDEEYAKPENKEKIASEIKTFSELTHHLDQNGKMKSADPSLSILSGYLKDDADNAYKAFKEGRINYARNVMRSVTANCIACHTRNAYGPEFAKLSFEPTALALKPLEKAKFYSATRQFDRAIEEFTLIFKGNGTDKSTPWEKEDAIREALAIAVRVKKSPELAEKIINLILSDQTAAFYIKQDANAWKKSIQEWKAEPKKSVGSLQQARKLLSRAKETQKYAMDHSGDILFLRASAALYDFFQAEPNSKNIAEAFQLQGICYEALNPKRLENLNQLFYEACIKRQPHTSLSQDCYGRLEQSIYMGFTGSAGVDIPQIYKSKLLELWSIALPKEKLKLAP